MRAADIRAGGFHLIRGRVVTVVSVPVAMYGLGWTGP